MRRACTTSANPWPNRASDRFSLAKGPPALRARRFCRRRRFVPCSRPMEPSLRARFNADFSPARYEAFLNCVQHSERWPADFRISETPVFLTREFAADVVDAANEIVARTRTPEFARHVATAIPPGLEVPGESAHPNFLVVDFGICEEAGRLTPRLIELQGFPS